MQRDHAGLPGKPDEGDRAIREIQPQSEKLVVT